MKSLLLKLRLLILVCFIMAGSMFVDGCTRITHVESSTKTDVESKDEESDLAEESEVVDEYNVELDEDEEVQIK